MCGIFGITNDKTNQAAQTILDGLKKLEYRGYDSWGIAVIAQGFSTIQVEKHAGKIGEAKTSLPSATMGIGHTRWATHGGVTDINAHPHLDCTQKIAVIHNGIIENYDEIKKKLIKLGHKFVSETDTEVAAHLIEEYYFAKLARGRASNTQKIALDNITANNKFIEAVRRAFLEFKGLSAIIALNSEASEFIAIKTGSPLVVGFGLKENLIASDAVALLDHTRRVHFLEDKEMVRVTKDKVELFDSLSGKPKKPKIQTLEWKIKQAEKGEYPNFMFKEIFEQPGIIADIAANSVSQAETLSGIIKKSYGSYLLGCGSASYVALAGSYLFSKITKRHINFAIGSEFGYHLDFLTPKSLIIALSQSGETMDILESVKQAKARGAKIFALVNVFGSSLYRLADYKMLIGAGPEKSVASTKAVTGKISHLTLLAYALAGKAKEGQTVVMQAAKSATKVLGQENLARLKKLAKQLKKIEHIYVIGRGLSYPASLETAMKIKEISYIHAEGMAAGELKHGPLALVEKGTPCIVFLPNDETYGANLAGAMEMKARGGYIIGISNKKHEIVDYFLPVDDAREATIIPNIITGQLLAYYLTLEKGLDPDKPRNLAKSVTVK